MNTSRPDFSIVLPAHNEAGNVAPMTATLKSIVAKLGPAEIIFFDDGSTDGTLAALRAAAADLGIRYVSFTRNFGHQEALRAAPRMRTRGHRYGRRFRTPAGADSGVGRRLARRRQGRSHAAYRRQARSFKWLQTTYGCEVLITADRLQDFSNARERCEKISIVEPTCCNA